MVKLTYSIVRKIEEEKKEEEEEEDESENEEEEEEEEEELDVSEIQILKKDSKQVIQSRRMVKATRTSHGVQTMVTSTVTKTAIKVPINVKSAKAAASKSQPTRKAATGEAKAAKLEDDGDNEMSLLAKEDNASEGVEMIDTSKRRPASRVATKKRGASMPKVGEKRLRKTPKKNIDEDEDGEEPSGVEGSMAEDEENSGSPVKKRKVGAG